MIVKTEDVHMDVDVDRHDWRYATAYVGDKPVASIKRRGVFDYGMVFDLHATGLDGRLIAVADTAQALRTRIARYLRLHT